MVPKLPSVFKGIMHAVDWLPTLAAIVGAKPRGRKLDGVNQLRAFKSGEKARDELFLGYSMAGTATHGCGITKKQCTKKSFTAYRYKQYKLLRDPNQKTFQLFDLNKDPGEKRDIKKKHREIFQLMRAKMLKAENDLPRKGYVRKCPKMPLMQTPWKQRAVKPWCK